MFRSHGTDTPREVWRFGQPGEMFYDTLVAFLELRYRLIPYIYSMAFRVYRDDYTLMRALPFDFRHDSATYDVNDQFMFGPSLLVCPVTKPMYYEAGSKPIEGASRKRSVYLPKGCQWIDFWDNRIYDGGQTVEADAPLSRMPLYVKSGSILPMKEGMQHANDEGDGRLYVHIYTGQDASFEYYEDEGDRYEYEQGVYAVIPMEWDEVTRTFTLDERKGNYPGMSAQLEITLTFYKPDAKNYHEMDVIERTVTYKGQKLTMTMDGTS